jgi:ParB family chromosome partitioning protein
VLEEVPDAGPLLASLSTDDLAALLKGPDFEPATEGQQSRLDEKKKVICPECGHEFTR